MGLTDELRVAIHGLKKVRAAGQISDLGRTQQFDGRVQLICSRLLSRGHGWAGRLTGCGAAGPFFVAASFDLGQRVRCDARSD